MPKHILNFQVVWNFWAVFSICILIFIQFLGQEVYLVLPIWDPWNSLINSDLFNFSWVQHIINVAQYGGRSINNYCYLTTRNGDRSNVPFCRRRVNVARPDPHTGVNYWLIALLEVVGVEWHIEGGWNVIQSLQSKLTMSNGCWPLIS